MGRTYWMALSFANLVYLRAWSDLLPLSPAFLYYQKRLPTLNLYLAIAGDVLALSLLTYLLLRIAPRLPGWLQRSLLAIAIGLAGTALDSAAPDSLRSFTLRMVFAALWAVAAVLTFLFFKTARRVARWATLAATPCLAVTFVGSLCYFPMQRPLPPDPPLAGRVAGLPSTRVIWVIFDEWDQDLSFTNRAPGLLLPALDGLAGRSFAATRAVAVQEGTPIWDMATLDAIPSLLYGRHLVRSEVEDAATRNLVFAGGDSVVFGEDDNIFARIRSHGWNAAAAGWYLPYCRVFGAQLTDCYWDVAYERRSSASPEIIAAAVDETRMLFETKMFSLFGPSLVLTRHRQEYDSLMAVMRRYAADPSIGFAFFHMNIPHVPYFYDPKVGRLGQYGYSLSLYNSALEWVDRSVADLLTTLDRAGLSSKTAVILSSDHPLRNYSRDPYVPFIVHLPGDNIGALATQEFSTIESARLVMAIASGEVKSSDDIKHVLGILRR